MPAAKSASACFRKIFLSYAQRALKSSTYNQRRERSATVVLTSHRVRQRSASTHKGLHRCLFRQLLLFLPNHFISWVAESSLDKLFKIQAARHRTGSPIGNIALGVQLSGMAAVSARSTKTPVMMLNSANLQCLEPSWRKLLKEKLELHTFYSRLYYATSYMNTSGHSLAALLAYSKKVKRLPASNMESMRDEILNFVTS